MKKDYKLYIKLFLYNFEISALTFGGGFVIISLMKKKFVDKHGWFTEKEMLDFTAIAQSSPGAIAVNAAMLVGFRMAGVIGAAITIVATILPPLVILSVISLFYTAFKNNITVQKILKGMQAGVATVIVDVVLSMGGKIIKEKNIIYIAIMILSFVSVAYFKIHIIIIILSSALIGALLTIINKNRKGDNNDLS